MIYGIPAAKDVKLSNISRTLKEDQALIKTEDRLSRNLDNCDFTDGINDKGKELYGHKEYSGSDVCCFLLCLCLYGQNIKLKLLIERIFIVSKRFFGVPSFFNYAIADGVYNLLYSDKTALKGPKPKTVDDFQLFISFG